LALLCASLPVQLLAKTSSSSPSTVVINAEGAVRASTQLAAIATETPLLGVIDTTGGASLPLIRAATLTDVSGDSLNCISLTLAANKAVLYATYQTMFGSKFGGSRVADFVCSTCSSVVVVLQGADAMDVLQGHEQVLRKVAARLRLANTAGGRALTVSFLVDVTASPAGSVTLSAEALSRRVQTFFSEVCADTTGQVTD
jgi:hypothetical protein